MENKRVIWERVLYLTFLFQVFAIPLQVFGQQHVVDSLNSLMHSQQDDVKKMPILLELVKAYGDVDLETGVKMADQGISMSLSAGQKLEAAAFMLEKGHLQEMLGLYDASHATLDQAILTFREAGEKSKLVKAIYLKAETYQRQGKFNDSFKTFMLALNLFEELKDRKGIGNVYAQLSDILFFQKQYKEGIDYGLQAIQIFKEINEPEEMVFAYDATGSNYIAIKEYEKAIEMLDKAVEIKQKLAPGTLGFGSILNSRGNTYKNGGYLEKALQDYQESYEIAEKFGHKGGMSAVSANVSDVFMRMGKYEAALPYQLKSVELMEESGFLANSLENYTNLSLIYEKLGDYKNATAALQKYIYTRDSLVSVDQDLAVMELSAKYESEKKEATIALQEAKISRQNLLQWLGLALISLLGLILFLTYRNYRNKKHLNEKMAATNELLFKRNKENEVLLREIHHRVKNNLQTISSLLSLQSESIDDRAAYDAVQESKNRVSSMALIHQKLYQGNNIASIEMRNYFSTLGNAILEGFGEKAKNVALNVDMEEIELDVDAAIPIGLITNELITNSMKHAFAHGAGEISIRLRKLENDMYELYVADNGKSEDQNSATAKKDGFGTLLVQLLTAQLRGNMDVSREKGTAMILRFPPPLKSVV